VLVLAALTPGPVFAAPVDLPVTLQPGAAWRIDSAMVIEKHSSTGESRGTGRSAYGVTLRGDTASRRLEVTDLSLVAGQQPSPIALEYDVDAALTPLRITNWDELRRLRNEAVDKSGMPPKMIEDFKATTARISAQGAAQVLVTELPLLAMGQGLDLEVGQSASFKDVRTPPSGRAPTSLSGTFTLVSVDRQDRRAVVDWRRVTPSQPYSDAARAQFRELVARTNPKASNELPAMSEESSQACRFDIDMATGLASRAECDLIGSNMFVNGGGSGIEHQTIHLTITQTLRGQP